MPKISIIVPVYNTEKYINRCIDSILAQTFTDFECILIDDGSTDNCPAICDEYAAKDGRIIVIHQENKGVSAARNAGLDIARGEWIGFVDSDDWLEPDALGKLLNKQRETNADVVIGSFIEHFINKSNKCIFDNYVITDKQKMLSDLFGKRFKNLFEKLYRSSLFENINQPSNLVYGEDAVVNTQIICSNTCKKIAVMSDNIYNYDCSSGGISQGLVCSKENAINYFQSHVFIYEYLKQKQVFYGTVKIKFYQYIFSTIYKKLFYNVPKREVIMLIKEAKFPYFYFTANIKIIIFSLLNCVFIINQNLYKLLIKNYLDFRKKLL